MAYANGNTPFVRRTSVATREKSNGRKNEDNSIGELSSPTMLVCHMKLGSVLLRCNFNFDCWVWSVLEDLAPDLGVRVLRRHFYKLRTESRFLCGQRSE